MLTEGAQMILTRRHQRTALLAVLAAALSWMVATPTSGPATGTTPQPMTKVIVQGPAAVQHTVTQLGGRITHDLPMIGGFSARVPANDVPLISRLPGVRGVMPDLPTHVQSTPGTFNNLQSVYKKVTRGDSLANV